MKGPSMKYNNRDGLFLPILASLVVLIGMSITIVASFGANSRYMQKRNELSLICDLAASSAIEEVKASVYVATSSDAKEWPEWWQGLLPPHNKELNGNPTLVTPVTEKVFARQGIKIEDVSLSCIDRQTGHKKKAQGLLQISVTVSRGSLGAKTRVKRVQLYQFYLQPVVKTTEVTMSNPLVYHPTATYSLSLFPLCTIVKG